MGPSGGAYRAKTYYEEDYGEFKEGKIDKEELSKRVKKGEGEKASFSSKWGGKIESFSKSSEFSEIKNLKTEIKNIEKNTLDKVSPSSWKSSPGLFSEAKESLKKANEFWTKHFGEDKRMGSYTPQFETSEGARREAIGRMEKEISAKQSKISSLQASIRGKVGSSFKGASGKDLQKISSKIESKLK